MSLLNKFEYYSICSLIYKAPFEVLFSYLYENKYTPHYVSMKLCTVLGETSTSLRYLSEYISYCRNRHLGEETE